jgi:hypothetical protein
MIDMEKSKPKPDTIHTISLKVPDMMENPGDMTVGEIIVSLGIDDSVTVFNHLNTEETFLVAIHAWSRRDSYDESMEVDSEKWLLTKLQEESKELPKFPLKISDDLVIDEHEDKGYVFEDGEGNKMSYNDVVEIMKSIEEFYK